MKRLKHDLLTSRFTEVFHEDEFKYNTPQRFEVIEASADDMPTQVLANIHFQEGPINECGVNGVCNEDLLAMVICRLEHFQKSEFACKENEMAICRLEEAMLWLRKRTMGRESRGVLGTHNL